jgi:glycerol kinase
MEDHRGLTLLGVDIGTTHVIDGSGEPLAWFDGRTAPQAARWRERLDPIELFSRTGLHLAPRCTACKLEWHRENIAGSREEENLRVSAGEDG